MLKGYLNCIECKNLLLRYINFELPRNEMNRIAIHLRNCPNCTEEYSKILLRKKNLKAKMKIIEKQLRMQLMVSSYIDDELTEISKQSVENMIFTDEKYKIELQELKEILILIHKTQNKFDNELKFKNSDKIIKTLRAKKIKKIRIMKKISQLFGFLHHGSLKFQ